jgi:hypothetical protein
MKRSLRTYWLSTNVSVRKLGAVDRRPNADRRREMPQRRPGAAHGQPRARLPLGPCSTPTQGGVSRFMALSEGQDSRVKPAYAGRRDCVDSSRPERRKRGGRESCVRRRPARHSQNRRPVIVTATSSKCHRDVGLGRRRRSFRANNGPNFKNPSPASRRRQPAHAQREENLRRRDG